jgi:hypothetical protein
MSGISIMASAGRHGSALVAISLSAGLRQLIFPMEIGFTLNPSNARSDLVFVGVKKQTGP